MEKDRKGVSGALGVLQTAVVLRVIRKKVTLEKGLEMKELSTHMSGKNVPGRWNTRCKGPKMETDHIWNSQGKAEAIVPAVNDLLGEEAREVMGREEGRSERALQALRRTVAFTLKEIGSRSGFGAEK